MLWLRQAVNNWEIQLPHPAALTVALNLAVFLLSKEEYFLELNASSVIERFIKLLKMMLENMGSTPDVGYVRLLACCLNHNSGCQWMLSTSYWSEILNLSTHIEQNTNLEKNITMFMCKLLMESIENNREFCWKIIHLLLSPTIDFSGIVKNMKSANAKLFNVNCLPRLNLLENMLELFLDKNINEKTYDILKLVLATSEKCEFEKHVIKICHESLNEQIDFKLLNILFFLRLLDIISNTKDTTLIEYSNILPYIRKAESLRRTLIIPFQKFFPKTVFNMIKYFSKIRNIFPKIRISNDVIYTFDDTLIFFQLLPIHTVSCYFSSKTNYNFQHDEFRENRITERLKKLPPITFYQVYQFRDYIEDQFSFDYSLRCIKYILESEDYYSRSQAINALGVLISSLGDFIEILEKNVETMVTSSTPVEYLGYLMETITFLINKFNLKWQDTFETMIIMEMMLSIFSIPGLSSHVSTIRYFYFSEIYYN